MEYNINDLINSRGVPEPLRDWCNIVSQQLQTAQVELSSAKEENVKLKEELAACKVDADQLREQIGKDMKPATIGKAIYRACEELPDGYDLHVECERGAGGVRLYLYEADASIDDFGSDNTLAENIHNAINIAIAAANDASRREQALEDLSKSSEELGGY